MTFNSLANATPQTLRQAPLYIKPTRQCEYIELFLCHLGGDYLMLSAKFFDYYNFFKDSLFNIYKVKDENFNSDLISKFMKGNSDRVIDKKINSFKLISNNLNRFHSYGLLYLWVT